MTAMRARMRKEIEMLESDPPHGISAWPKDDKIDHLEAQILGPDGSPYEKGVFYLDIEIPERYPFEPPKVRFTTPIYHPNIDDAGRICLDTLKMQPKGSWMPSVNISTLLTTIRLLMAEPNADDGLMPDITDLFKHNRELFNRKATELTMQHAQSTAETTQSSSEAVTLKPAVEVATAATTEKAQAPSPKKAAKAPRKDSSVSEDSFSDGDSSDESDGSIVEDEGEMQQASKRQRRN